MFVDVVTTSNEQKLSCGDQKRCKVNYSWAYTPEIHAVIPSMIYPGMTPTFAMSPHNAGAYKRDSDMFTQLRVDGTSVDLKEYYDEDNKFSGGMHFFKGPVHSEERNSDASVSAFFRGTGYAMIDQKNYNTTLLDGESSYGVKVMPTVSSISSHQGFAEGGQELTITGTSLDGDAVTVTVDGLPCKDVKKIGTTGLTCTTSEKVIDPNEEAPLSYIGQQGLEYKYRPHHGDEKDMLWTALDVAGDKGFQHNSNFFKGFFKAPYTGDIRFLMACDDNCKMHMSLEDPLNPDNLTQIMKSDHHRYWR
jgi:hypothetical protein